jgi:hypothetical protein
VSTQAETKQVLQGMDLEKFGHAVSVWQPVKSNISVGNDYFAARGLIAGFCSGT